MSKLKIILLSLLGLGLVGGGYGAYRALPYYRAWVEARAWNPAFSDTFSDPQSVDSRWNGRHAQLVPPQGGLRLQMDYLMHRLEALPRQPFEIRVKFKVINPGQGARFLASAASAVELFDQPAPQGGTRRWTRWGGPFAEVEIRSQLRMTRLGSRELDGSESSLASSVADLTDPASTHQLRLRFDGDILSARFDAEPAEAVLSTFVKMLPGHSSEGLRVGLSGLNVSIESVDLALKKNSENLELVSRADDFRLAGDYAKALQIYGDLVLKAGNSPERGRFLFKKGLAHAAAGEAEFAAQLYRQVLEAGEKSDYACFAALELAEPELKKAIDYAKSDKVAEAMDSARQATAWLRPFVDTARPDPRARMLLLRVISGPLNDKAGAERLAREIIRAKNDPYAASALDLLLNEVLVPESAWSNETLAMLDKEISLGRAGVGSLYDHLMACRALVLERMGQGKAYFETLEAIAADPAFSARERDQVFKRVDQLSWQTDFRVAMMAWKDTHEKNDWLRMARFCRDFLTTLGLRLNRNISDFSAHSPMALMALQFIESHVVIPESNSQGLPASEPYFQPDLKLAHVWGDRPQKEPALKAGKLLFKFDSGVYYGCGLNLFAKAPDSDQCVDLQGCRAVDITVKVPKDLAWSITLSEGGVGSPSSGDFGGPRGADGEQYFCEQRRGTGKWETERFLLSGVRPNPHWGNQNGNFNLDLQAIRQVDLVLEKAQGAGELELGDIVFVR